MDHRCARAENCAQAEKIDLPAQSCTCDCHFGPHYVCSIDGGCGSLHNGALITVGSLIEQRTGFCDVCGYVVVDAIGQLPHDYVSLRIAQYRGLSPVLGEVVSSSRELPIPISLAFSTLAEQIEVMATAFAEPVAEQLGIDWDRSTTPYQASRHGPSPRYTGPVLLDRSIRLLARATTTLIALPAWEYRLWGDEGWTWIEVSGPEAAMLLLSLHYATRATLGLTKAHTMMQAECPYCKTQTLMKPAGKDLIQCQLCARWFTERDYEQWSIFVIGSNPKPSKKPRRQSRKTAQEIHSSADGTVGRPVEIY